MHYIGYNIALFKESRENKSLLIDNLFLYS